MTTVFVICAAIGCTVLVFQFVLTMIGLGGEAMDLDISADMDADLDFDGDIDHGHVDSTWLFGVISFRTIVAALAFFGLAGLAADEAGTAPLYTILIAVLSGLGAMYGVYWIYRAMSSLRSDGTVRIGRALGAEATAYTTIPAENSASGKIQINLQSQLPTPDTSASLSCINQSSMHTTLNGTTNNPHSSSAYYAACVVE